MERRAPTLQGSRRPPPCRRRAAGGARSTDNPAPPILARVGGKALSADQSSRLHELDRTHWLHPQGDLDAPLGTIPQLIFTSGTGATLTDVDGREYIDGMASLWNVNVGYGPTHLPNPPPPHTNYLSFPSPSQASATPPPSNP